MQMLEAIQITMRSKYLDMCEGVHTDVIYPNRFDKSSDLSTTYLGKTTVTRETKIKAEEKFPLSGQGVYFEKTVRWHRMSNSVRYWCTLVLHVKIILFEVPNSVCIAQISFKYTQRIQVMKWSICGCTVCNTTD